MTQQPDVSMLIGLINEATVEGKILAEYLNRGIGGREIALTITKLEEARHRAVDAMILLQSQEEGQSESTIQSEETTDTTTARNTD